MTKQKNISEQIQGVATKVHFTTDQRGGSVALLELDGRRVQIDFSFVRAQENEINNGDIVAVSGTTRDGILQAVAYHNVTRNDSKTSIEARFFLNFGIVGSCVGLAILWVLSYAPFSVLAAYSPEEKGAVSLMFFLVSIVFLLRSRKMVQAYNKLIHPPLPQRPTAKQPKTNTQQQRDPDCTESAS
ncbi:MAG: hypothetical protein HQL77_05560 [Magnetococcales bacterium]|nr:hypothetical protein [Magnetococcales bacterium]